jgi:F-type H+-transporting ATPase subunit b
VSFPSVGLLAAEAHSNPLIPESNELIWGTVSFLVLLVLVGKFVFPTIDKTFKDRTANIEGKLDRAEKERQDAQDLLEQYKRKLDEAHAEAQRIVDQARSNADRLEAELRVKAEEEAQRIVERARAAVGAERERAIAELRGEVGSLAVDLASRVVGESLDRDRHLHLVDQYINELQSAGASDAR